MRRSTPAFSVLLRHSLPLLAFCLIALSCLAPATSAAHHAGSKHKKKPAAKKGLVLKHKKQGVNGNRIVAIKGNVSLTYEDENGNLQHLLGIEVTLYSPAGFPIGNDTYFLTIGGQQFALSRYPDDSDGNTLVFSMTQKQFDNTVNGAPVVIRYGLSEQSGLDFGAWDKSQLQP